jgi:hypothetical protein
MQKDWVKKGYAARSGTSHGGAVPQSSGAFLRWSGGFRVAVAEFTAGVVGGGLPSCRGAGGRNRNDVTN